MVVEKIIRGIEIHKQEEMDLLYYTSSLAEQICNELDWEYTYEEILGTVIEKLMKTQKAYAEDIVEEYRREK